MGWGQQLVDLPNDPATKVGKLDNGLTYYIRHNDKPAQRAEFYLATNVGAIQETPDQDGLAHFLEHMCFNGTKNFPEKGILNWLESIGASFGGNVNASTGVEQTIYLLNNIPLVRPTVVDTCILIMHDYSHFVTCDPVEIDKERGVIIEERRSRRDASWRLHEQSLPYYYGDSKYATCTLIGSQENLQNFKPESLTNFYHTWYRPDNQALIVVGDIDVDEVEAKIKDIFSDIPAPVDPKAKDVIMIPDNSEPVIGILTDPEATSTNIEMLWKSEATPEEYNSTQVGLINDILEDIIGTVMNERLSDITSKADAPFLDAYFGIGDLCETCEVVEGDIVCRDGEALNAFAAFLIEAEKLKRFGFSDSEIERAKTEILSRYETAANKADTRKNSEFVMPMINHFFDNDSFMDPAMKYELVQQMMPALQTAIVNQVAQQIITPENFVVVYKAPAKEGLVHPTEEQLRAVIKMVAEAELEQAEGEDIPAEFLNPASLKGSKIKKSAPYMYDSEIITLKNGIQVILLPTDYEKDRVSIQLFKKGGQSLISDEDLYSFDSNIWSLYQSNTGVAAFPATTVNKMLAGKQVSAYPFISSYSHGVSASTTRKDLETAFQLMYLYYTQPRFDAEEYAIGINQIEAVLPNLVGTPNYKLQDELYKTVYDSPRRMMISQEVVDKASLETLAKEYKKLFKDAAGATAVIVGDFDKAEVLPMVQKYFGSIAKGKKATDWKYCGDGIIDGKKINDFAIPMQTPKATVAQIYKINAPYDVNADVAYKALNYILDMVYVETLREDEGGTYGASAVAQVSDEPYPVRLLQVVFETNPSSADKLRALAIDGLKKIAEEGPTAEMYDKTVKNLEKKIPESRIRNSYWANALMEYMMYGKDGVNDYEAAVKALTPEKVKAAAAELLNSGNFVELVMRPSEAAEAE